MPDTSTAVAQVHLLDSGYSREARSLLYHAYRHEPTFAYLFEAERSGYEQRVRATVRELVKQHFLQELPAIGLLVNDRLIGIALIAPPQRRLGITESWAWQLRMWLSTGFRCTRRYLEYHQAVLACLPSESVHVLPLLGSTRNSSASITANNCWKPCITGAPKTRIHKGWCWIPAIRCTWSSTNARAMPKWQRWL